MIVLQLTDQQMDYIASVLAQRPWGEVNGVLSAIQAQIKEQQHARHLPNGSETVGPEGLNG